MTVELSLLISGISVAFAIYFGIANKNRNSNKDLEERVKADTRLMTKLDMIADDLKDIKRENEARREEIENVKERVIKVEQSLKAYHKRLDEGRAHS